MKKTKIVGTIIGVLIFTITIIGITYAWFIWHSSNINITGSSECFTIDYGISQEIGANQAAGLTFGESYTDGLYAVVTLGLNSLCSNISGSGKLYLNTNTAGTDTEILGGALKYTVVRVNGVTKTAVANGAITSTNRITLLDNINLTSLSGTYTYEVWVWLDGNIADNNYYGKEYSGYISAEANQVE